MVLRTGSDKMKNISARKVLSAMIYSEGRLSDAARMLHTQPRNIARIIDENPEIQEELDQCHNGLYEKALAAATELVSACDRKMTQYILDRLGEKRGLKKPKSQVQVSGDPKNPLVTKKQIDLSNLSDEELEVLGKALSKGKNEENEGV